MSRQTLQPVEHGLTGHLRLHLARTVLVGVTAGRSGGFKLPAALPLGNLGFGTQTCLQLLPAGRLIYILSDEAAGVSWLTEMV